MIGRVAQHRDSAHRHAHQHHRPGAGSSGGDRSRDVVVLEIAERAAATGLAVAAGVVGDHVEVAPVDRARQRLDVGMGGRRGEPVRDDHRGAWPVTPARVGDERHAVDRREGRDLHAARVTVRPRPRPRP